MASEPLLTVSRDEAERAMLDHEYKNALDMQSLLVEAKREGLAEGKMEGLAEGENKVLELVRQGYTAEQIEAELSSFGEEENRYSK
ncbi:hypothetical protein FACS1894163_06620 [Spirochaetia bacterium]|nr:hypothetical protein FACS1894163_06620 [Spirochaetia bacterium]